MACSPGSSAGTRLTPRRRAARTRRSPLLVRARSIRRRARGEERCRTVHSEPSCASSSTRAPRSSSSRPASRSPRGRSGMPDGALPLQRHARRQAAPLARRARASTSVRDPSNKCNGMTLDSDGNLIVCEHVTSSVVRSARTARARLLATHCEGKELNSPNDVVVALGRHDLLHRSDLRADAGLRPRARAGARLPGRLPDPAGRRRARLLVDDFAQPNGLCFSPDESLLYVNDTDRAHIRAFDVGRRRLALERPGVRRGHRRPATSTRASSSTA